MSVPEDAARAAALFAVDPAGLGGVCLHSLPQPARDAWLTMLRELLPGAAPVRRIPCGIETGRLLGGLDVAASLAAGRPVVEHGVLAATDGGVLIAAMAERMPSHTARCLCAVLDAGEVVTQREGVDIRAPAHIGVVALDEGLDEEHVPAVLLDRMAFLLDLNGFDPRTPLPRMHQRAQIERARRLLAQVTIGGELAERLCATALALGAGSVRVSLLAVRAARAAAALDGRAEVSDDDAVIAGRLVLAPRASRLPQPSEPSEPGESSEPNAAAEPPERSAQEPPSPPLDPGEDARGEVPDAQDLILAAAQAAIPPGLLDRLRSAGALRSRVATPGRAGSPARAAQHGRPVGVQSATSRSGARLHLLATLRAAVPWQRLRGRGAGGNHRIRIERGDLRSIRYQQRSRTITIFAVDASGSSALNRLGEAKGAVELLLAECYVRRDLVAVITFRGRQAQLLLPPTRSLVRAKRELAGLPGGGGTPLASAIDTGALLAGQARRRGETPLLVMLSDGRANVALDGSGGRAAAHADALRAAGRLRALRIPALFIDTSPRASAQAEEIAGAMQAEYLPLPFADAQAVSRVVNAALPRAARGGAARVGAPA